MQVYDGPRFPIVHADFYRLRGADELAQIGWDEAIDGAVTMVEWPERAGERAARRPAGDRAPFRPRLRARIPPRRRCARSARSARAGGARAASSGCCAQAGWADAERAPLAGDASVRAYERLTKPDGGDRDPDDLAAAARRPDPALRQTLRGDRQAVARHPRLLAHGRGPARPGLFDAAHLRPRRRRRPGADRGFRRRDHRRRERAEPRALRRGDGAARRSARARAAASSCRSTARPTRCRPTISTRC